MKKFWNLFARLANYLPNSPITKEQQWNLYILSLACAFTTFGGALRKWLLPGGVGNLLLFIQLIIPFLLFTFFKKVRLSTSSINIIIVYSLVLIGMAVNPMNQTIYHGLFGIVLHLGLWLPLFLYLDNRAHFHIERLIPLLILFCTIELLLGLVQYSLPPGHFLNRYSADVKTEYISVMGSGIRVTGTFSYLSGYTAFIIGWNLCTWALFLFRFPAWLGYLGIATGLICSLISGSRAAVALSIITAAFSLLAGVKGQQIVNRIISTILVLGLFMSIGWNTSFVQKIVGNFMGRVTGNFESGESHDRTLGVLEEIYNYKGEHALFGMGLGSTYQGSNTIWGESSYVKQYGGYEEELERIVIEGGFVLLIFKVFLILILIFNSKINRLSFTIFMGLIIVTTPIVFNTYNAFYFYIGVMLLDRAYTINTKTK
jgi:hypothetical protein